MTIRSRPSTDTYRENYQRIFGVAPGRFHIPGIPDTHVSPDGFILFDYALLGLPTESLDSHPAAD